MIRGAWSEDEVIVLRGLYEQGMPEAEIAAALGRTKGAVANLRQGRGITRPVDAFVRGAPWTDRQLRVGRTMFEQGFWNSIISQQVERSAVAVERMATTLGWKRVGFSWSASFFDTEDEEWRAVLGGTYAVSSAGRILSLLPPFAGRYIRPWRNDEGYEHATLQVDKKSKRHPLHRLVAIAFLGEPAPGRDVVAHKNGTPWDNRVDNLRWATLSENSRDRVKHGTAIRGTRGRYVRVWEGPRVSGVRDGAALLEAMLSRAEADAARAVSGRRRR